MSDALNAGTVVIKVQYALDNEQLRAVAEQGRAELEQQMAGIKIGMAADAQAAAARGQASLSPSLLANLLPPVATGAGGGSTSPAMAQATRQARLDSSRARMAGGRSAQIDSLIKSAQAIGGTAGEWLETAATMMFAQTKEAFTKSAQAAAKKSEQQVARDKNAINRVSLVDAKALSSSALSTRNLSPEDRGSVLQRAQNLRADYGVDYKTSVSAATADFHSRQRENKRTQSAADRAERSSDNVAFAEFKAGERQTAKAERNRELAGLSQQKAEEKAVVSAKNKNNQLELQAEKDRSSASLKARDLSKDELKSVQDRADALRREHGTSYRESFGAALGELNDGRRATAQAGRLGVDQFLADIADQTPGGQRRSIRNYLNENEDLHPRDRIRLERQRAGLFKRTPIGQFFGEPNTSALALNAMFGGIEVGHAALAFGRASHAVGNEDQYKAYSQAADSVAGGFLGSFANMVVDPYGDYRAGSEAVAAGGELADARIALRKSGSREIRDARTVANNSGSVGIAAHVAAVHDQANDLRDRAEHSRDAHDQVTEAEVLNQRAQLLATRDKRADDRLRQLPNPKNLTSSGIEARHQQFEDIKLDISREDDKVVQDFRTERGKERDKVVAAYKASADVVEKNGARKIFFDTVAGAITNYGQGLVAQADNSGDPRRAGRVALQFQQAKEAAALEENFRGTGHDNPLYIAASAAMSFLHLQQRTAFYNQQDLDLVKTRLGTRAITDRTAGRSLESSYSSIDEQMGVQQKNGELWINGYAPGADGYSEQQGRRDAMRTAAGVDFRREQESGRTFERSAQDQLNDQPLTAQIDKILGDATSDTKGMDGRGTTARARWRQAALQVKLAQQDAANQTRDIETGQLFETKAMTQEILRNPIGAEADRVAGSSLASARRLFRSERPEDAANEIKLGNEKLDATQAKYVDSFEAASFDPRTSGFDAHNAQNPNDVFGSIDAARNDLNTGGLSSNDDTSGLLGEIRDAQQALTAAFEAISKR